mgnify:CR=1 FL=1
MRLRTLTQTAALAALCLLMPAALTAQTAPLTITSLSPLPTATVGVSYTFTFQATGGVGPGVGYPYTWSLAAGVLPPGLNLSSNGTLSGTPTTAGGYSFRIRVTDIQGSTAIKDFTMDVINPVRIQTPSSLPSGAVGVPYTMTLTAAGGTTPYYWETTSSLPPGIALTSAGVLTGTPGVIGTYTFTVTVYDSTERSDSRTFTLAILTPLSIVTGSPLPNGAVGVSYSQSLGATGGSTPYTWSVSAGQLPPGLFINPNGVFTGTPSADGIYAFVVQVRDSAGLIASKLFSLTILPRLEITTEATLPRARVGTAYRQLFEASGGAPPYSWSSEDPMPPGMSFESAGAVSGRPTTTGTFAFSVTVTDSRGVRASKRFSLTVLPPLLSITTTSPLPNGRVGQAYSLTFAASGGAAPIEWSATGLPPGLQFSAAGALTGTPTATGSFTLTVTVTDAARETASGRFVITITAAPLEITTAAALPRARVAESYSTTFAAAGGAAPYSWSAASVPGGLSMSAGGVLSGIPNTAGSFTIAVTVTDSEKNTASRQFTLVIDPPRLVFTSASPLPAGRVGDAYSAQLTAAGGVPPYTWTGTGVPGGLSLSAAGLLSGTPTTAGTFTLNVTVADSAQGSVSQNFALTIAPPPLAITTASLASGAVGSAYAATLAATGGQPPYTWSLAAGTLPAGVSLSAAGELRGTPTAPGTFGFTARVTDSRGEQATRAFSVTVALPALPRSSVQGLDANVNPVQQPQVSLLLDSAFPILVSGRLTLTFTSDATNPADDPAVQFSTGGRTVDFTIPAGQTRAVFPAATLAIQTGTVAGRIVVTAQFRAAGVDVTPSPAPSFTATVRAAAPVISSVRATRTSTGIEVVVTGFSTPRAMTQAVFRFAPSGVGTLQTTELTVPLDTVFTTWYRSDASRSFGSSFSYTQPFTVTGNVAAIGSVSVTLTNAQGSSQPMSAAIQ